MGMIFTRRLAVTSVSTLDAWLATKNEVELEGIPLDTFFTYYANQTVKTITKASQVKTFTYNVDDTVNTINDGTYIKTFYYNPDKTVDKILVTMV